MNYEGMIVLNSQSSIHFPGCDNALNAQAVFVCMTNQVSISISTPANAARFPGGIFIQFSLSNSTTGEHILCFLS